MVLLRFGWSCLSGLISSYVRSFCQKKKKPKKKKSFSCLFYNFRLIFVFIFLFHFFFFFCSSWYLTEIKIYNNQLDQDTSPPSLYFTCLYLVLMLHIHILLSFHSRHIFKSIIFNIEDNVWFRFGGDVYRFLSFCFALFCLMLKKIKKKKNLLPSLRFMFWVCYTTLA